MRTHGFSLIELVIALAVMGLLILAVSPSLSDWMINLRVRNATDALLSGLQQARQEAIRRNQKVSFWLVTPAADPSLLDSTCALSSASGSWVVSVRTPVGNCAATPSATTAPMLVSSHPVGDGASGVTIAAVAADGSAATTVEFNGTGSVSNASPIAKIDVSSTTNSSSHRSLRIEITGVGALRMCDPAVISTDARACKL